MGVDHKADQKSKWVKKTHSMDVLSELSSSFVKISFCDASLSSNMFNNMHAKWMCYTLTQGIRTIKT